MISAKNFLRTGLFLITACLLALAAQARPFAVKVAVVTTFEVGADKGDKPGEFQFWAEREKWTGSVLVPGVTHPVLINDETGVIGVVSGTTVRATQQIMALVMSGQFDFTHTYWLINGIAGVDPEDASIGSAAWAQYVIDGDISYEIDSREADPSWPYGITAIGAKRPGELPKSEGWEPDQMAFELSPTLVSWAYALTKSTEIPDSDEMKTYRALYTTFPKAQKPPFVLIGDSLGSCRYWHGVTMTKWANDWAKLWTNGKANYVMTNMEDQGIAYALSRLEGMGKVDFKRVLFLRTGSNYCVQPAGMDVNKSLHVEYAGYLPSLEAAYRVGSKVVHTLVADWPTYGKTPPGK